MASYYCFVIKRNMTQLHVHDIHSFKLTCVIFKFENLLEIVYDLDTAPLSPHTDKPTNLSIYLPSFPRYLCVLCSCNLVSYLSQVKAVIVGLGAGLLPMFLHGCLPLLHIEVIFWHLPPHTKKENGNEFQLFLRMYFKEDEETWYLQVVELDPTVLNLARDYFGFSEDERLQVVCSKFEYASCIVYLTELVLLQAIKIVYALITLICI